MVGNVEEVLRSAVGPTVVARARERNVLIFAFGPRVIRAVTHLDVSAADCARAGELVLESIEAPTR